MNEWKNKSILITGAASGIGKETAIKYSKLGTHIYVADINYKALKKLKKDLKKINTNIHIFKVDVSSKKSVNQLFRQVLKKTKTIDTLINNVGIEISGDMSKFSLKNYKKLFKINTKSVFLCTQKAIPFMKKGGSIINLASVASFKTWPNDGVYSATKAAVLALTKGFAIDLAKRNIRVNAVAPAIIDTPMTDRSIKNKENLKKEKRKKGLIHPLKRLGKPQEIAEAIIFLSSNKSSFTTGSVLTIDGGLLA